MPNLKSLDNASGVWQEITKSWDEILQAKHPTQAQILSVELHGLLLNRIRLIREVALYHQKRCWVSQPVFERRYWTISGSLHSYSTGYVWDQMASAEVGRYSVPMVVSRLTITGLDSWSNKRTRLCGGSAASLNTSLPVFQFTDQRPSRMVGNGLR